MVRRRTARNDVYETGISREEREFYSIPPPPPVPRSRRAPPPPTPPRPYPQSTRSPTMHSYPTGPQRSSGYSYSREPNYTRTDQTYAPRRAYDRYDDDYYDDYDDKYNDRTYPREEISGRPSSNEDRKNIGTTKTKRSSGSRALGIIVILIFVLLILYLFRTPILNAVQNGDTPNLNMKYQEYPEQLDFTVRKSMTLQVNPTRDGSYISYKLKTACPKDRILSGDSEDFYIQDVKKIDVQPEPSTGYPDLGYTTPQIMVWEDSHFTGSKTFVVEYTITTRFFQWEISESDSGLVSNITDKLKTQYNQDEWRIDEDNDGRLDPEDDIDNDGEWDYMIEPSNPRIKNLAKQLVGDEQNVYKIVEKLYNYLIKPENLNYVTTNQGLPKACTQTLTEKRGDCDDYSILFISLCRALDVPAWLELGVLYDRQTRHWGGHAWSKVAIPLKTGGFTAPVIDIVNKQFMLFDPYRFVEWIDTGVEESIYPYEDKPRNNLDYYYHTFSYIATGNPQIISPDTNDFLTLSINEVGDKKRVAVNGDQGLDICMIPGFENSISLISLIILVFIVYISKQRVIHGR